MDTLRISASVLAPIVARGVIVRRPRVVAVLEKIDADRRAGRLLGRIADRRGPGPLLLRIPGRSVAVVLDPGDVHRVLAETPEPFSPATLEKHAALGHFQPDGVLISDPAQRGPRRGFNEAALEPGSRCTDWPAVPPPSRPRRRPCRNAALDGQLTWDTFNRGWWRLVRRVVLGQGARDDDALTDALDSCDAPRTGPTPALAATSSGRGSTTGCASTWNGPSRAAWPR